MTQNSLLHRLLLMLSLALSIHNSWAQNNTRASATLITPGSSFTNYTANIQAMTAAAFTPYAERGHSLNNAPSSYKDGWYKFVAQSGHYDIELDYNNTDFSGISAGGNLFYEIYRANAAQDSFFQVPDIIFGFVRTSTLSSMTGEKEASFDHFTKGATYFIRFASSTTAASVPISFQFRMRYTPTTGSNDLIENASLLTVGAGCTSLQSFGIASTSVGEDLALCMAEGAAFSYYAPTRWYKFVAPPGGLVRITTDVENAIGTLDRTRLALYQYSGSGDMSNYANYSSIACGAYEQSDFDTTEVYRRGSVYSPPLVPGQTYYVQLFGYDFWITTDGDEFCIKVDDLTTPYVSPSAYCSTDPEANINENAGGGYSDTTLNYKSWHTIRERDLEKAPVVALVKNATAGVNWFKTILSQGIVNTSGVRTTSDGRAYSKIYYTLNTTNAAAIGTTHDIILYVLESRLTPMNILCNNFKISRVPGNCVTTITPALESSITDITPTGTGLSANGEIRWIKFSTNQTGTFFIRKGLPITLTATQANVSCNGGSTGVATVTASGGTTPYSYVWTNSAATTATASGLSAGSYTCTVTDYYGCTATQTFTLTQPSAINSTITSTNVSCFGGGNGTATVIPSGGTPPYTYNWSPSGAITSAATGHMAGTYTCTITDANNCITSSTTTITAPAPLTTTAAQTNTCNGMANGSATITVSGGTTGYTYQWSPNVSNTASAANLSAGVYNVLIIDGNQCAIAHQFTITANPQPVLVTHDTTVYGNTTINLTAPGFTAGSSPALNYSYWTNAAATAPVANPTSVTAGTYYIVAQNSNGCRDTGSLVVNVVRLHTITGMVHNDANGLLGLPVNTIDGVGTNAGGVNAVLVHTPTDTVVSVSAVSSNGLFAFAEVKSGTYHLVLTNSPIIGNTSPLVTLPSGWVNTGEFLGIGVGSDAIVNGILQLGLVSANISNAKFGIERPPTAVATTYTIAIPAINNLYTLNGQNGNPPAPHALDPEELLLANGNTIIITNLPGNANLLYNNAAVTTGQEISNFNPNQLQLQITAAAIGSTSCSFSFNYKDAAGMPGFTPATYALDWGVILPVKMGDFTAKSEGSKVVLAWHTLTELNNKGFYIERSGDGVNWNDINFVATQAHRGNSHESLTYGTYDEKPTPGINYYRLRQTDVNDNFTFSAVRIVSFAQSTNRISIYPNPTTDKVYLKTDNWLGIHSVRVLDMQGRTVYNAEQNEAKQGIDMSSFAEGAYLIIVIQEGNKSDKFKVTKMR